MKNTLLIMCILLILGGCSQEYKDIKPEIPISGTIAVIDSTQWTPVLMQTGDDKIFILDKSEIREIPLIDENIYGFTIMLAVGFVFALVAAFTDR